MIIEQA
jgi:hypothetical protein